MKYLLFLCATLFAVPVIAQQHPSGPSNTDAVWTWSKQCAGEHKLDVTIRHEGKILYHGILPVCHGSRQEEDGTAVFQFSAARLYQPKFRTHLEDPIEGDIWQAGGESDALILGISFATRNQILLNTLHVASPDKRVSTELDKGFFITTYPVIVR